MSIIDDLIEKDRKIYKTVKAKISEDTEQKIKFICEKTGV